MTPERLEQLVLGGDTARLAEELGPLEEKERKKLSKSASTLYRLIRKGEPLASASERFLAFLKRAGQSVKQGAPHGATGDAALALLGVGPLAAAKRTQIWFLSPEQGLALEKILLDRRPDWLGAWVEHELERDFTILSWNVVRRWVREGACPRPETDGYIQLMANWIEWRDIHSSPRHAVPRSEALLADEELLEHEIWKLFEVDTRAFEKDYTEENPRGMTGYESWKTALARLSEQGHLERDRLLDASLNGLTSGLSPLILTGFREFHLSLKPTLDDVEQRQDDYLHLLASPVGHVVSFTLTALSKLERADRLDGARFLQGAAAAFGIGTKGTASAVLRTTKRLVSRRDDLFEPAVEVVLAALTHPSNDIQSQAVELIASWRDDLPEAAIATLRARIEHVSSAARIQLAEWFALETDTVGESADERVALDALRERVEQLDDGTRRMMGLMPNPVGADRLSWPAPLALEIVDTCVLDEAEPLEPIAHVDELIDRVAHAVERVDSPDEVELILDGISRLCAQRPDYFEARTHALRERVRAIGAEEFASGLVTGTSATSLAVKDLLLTWLTGKRAKSKLTRWMIRSEPFVFAERRVQEITDRVAAGRESPLLATPTHRHGWLSSLRLVERLRSLDPDTAEMHRADFTQAILRLAPDDRASASAAAASLSSAWGRILRWALGGTGGPSSRDQDDYALWLAAARARAPNADFRSELSVLRLVDDLADGLTPSRFTWTAGIDEHRSFGRTYERPELDLTVSLAVDVPRDEGGSGTSEVQSTNSLLGSITRLAGGRRKTKLEDVPSAVLTKTSSKKAWTGYLAEDEWLLRWLALTWPLDPEAFFAAGARSLAGHVNENSSSWWPSHAYLDPLFVAASPWGEMAILLITVALVSKDADAATLACDALIDGVEDGRAHPGVIAQTLARLSEGGWVKPNRLATSLSTVAQVSELHALFVAQLVDALLVRLEPFPKNLHHVLELQWNLTVQLGVAPSEPLRDRLAALSGGSKTAKLAKKIAASVAATPSAIYVSAVARATEARLDRVARLV